MEKDRQKKKEGYIVSEEKFLDAIDKLEDLELKELEKIAAEAKENPHQFSAEFEEWKEAALREMEAREAMERIGEKEIAKRVENVECTAENKGCMGKNKPTETDTASDETSAAQETVPGRSSFIFRFLNTPVKKVAAAVLLILVATLGFGGQGEAGRFPMVKFIQEIYDDYIRMENPELLHSNKDKPQTIETRYELGWVPEGYEKVEEKEGKLSARMIYQKGESKEKIHFEQYCVLVAIAVEEEKDKYKEIKQEGRKYYYLDGEKKESLIWYQDGYQFVVRSSEGLDMMIKLAEGVRES